MTALPRTLSCLLTVHARPSGVDSVDLKRQESANVVFEKDLMHNRLRTWHARFLWSLMPASATVKRSFGERGKLGEDRAYLRQRLFCNGQAHRL